MPRDFQPGATRRELLKLSPALLLGAFAVPSLQGPLLSAGVRFSDRHLIMVALHGWDNVQSMLTGWKMSPDYRAAQTMHDQTTAD